MEPKKVAKTTLTVFPPGSFEVLAIFFVLSWTISVASNLNTAATDVAYKGMWHDLCITPLARPKHSRLGEVLGDRRAVISCDLGNSLHQVQNLPLFIGNIISGNQSCRLYLYKIPWSEATPSACQNIVNVVVIPRLFALLNCCPI